MKIGIFAWKPAKIILDWWNCISQLLTLQNQVQLGVFKGAESISALKTAISTNPKLQFKQEFYAQ
jgi:hypothetical protein